MGNSPARNFDLQREGFFSALPEDILILLTDILSTKDFVRLIMTCKYYYHDFLGGNNALWARVCRSLGGAEKILKELKQVREGPNLELKDLDLADKRVLASIDFKHEVFTYYVLLVNNQRLRRKLDGFFLYESPNVIIKVHPYRWTFFSQYWTRADLKSNKYPRDYFYEVDLTYDPVSVEEIFEGSQELPHEIGGRLVVYKKSKRKARAPGELLSRTESQIDIDIAEMRRTMDEILKEQEIS